MKSKNSNRCECILESRGLERIKNINETSAATIFTALFWTLQGQYAAGCISHWSYKAANSNPMSCGQCLLLYRHYKYGYMDWVFSRCSADLIYPATQHSTSIRVNELLKLLLPSVTTSIQSTSNCYDDNGWPRQDRYISLYMKFQFLHQPDAVHTTEWMGSTRKIECSDIMSIGKYTVNPIATAKRD
jgi:hypothetical protein